MPDPVNNRNEVNLRRWWESAELNACRAQLNTAVNTTLRLVEARISDPSDSRTPYRQRLALGLMPPNCFSGNMYRTSEGLRHEAHPFPQSNTMFFALMLHTWTTEALLSFAGRRLFPAEFDLAEYQGSIAGLLGENRYNGPNAVRTLRPNVTRSRNNFIRSVAVRGRWPEDPNLATCRDELVRAFITSFARALDAIPETVEREISTRANMSLIFDELEPFVRKAPLHTFITNSGSASEWIMRLLKTWWAEVKDAFVYDCPPSFPFNRSQRCGDIVRASVMLRHNTNEDPTEGQISSWVSLKDDHLYTYWCLMGDLNRANLYGTGVFYARHDVPLDEQRLSTHVPEVRLDSNWCTIPPWTPPEPVEEASPFRFMDFEGGHDMRCAIM